MTLTSFLRSLRPMDLLLPAGAALVTAGLQNLADRETRQRARLGVLDAAVKGHAAALADLGQPVDPAFVAEPHPLDPGVPWLAAYSGPPASDVKPAPAGRRLPTGAVVALGVLAAAGVAGVTVLRRGGFVPILASLVAEPVDELADDALPEPHPHSGVRIDLDELHETGETRIEGCRHHLYDDGMPAAEGQGELDPELESQDQEGPPPAEAVGEEAVDMVPGTFHGPVEPQEICEWPACDWTSDPGRSVHSQQTQAAVHRNRCIYRPAGAKVD